MPEDKKDENSKKEAHREEERKSEKYDFGKEKKVSHSTGKNRDAVLVMGLVIICAVAFAVLSFSDHGQNLSGNVIDTSLDDSFENETNQLLEEKLGICNSYLAVNDFDNSIVCLNEANGIKEDSRSYKALAEIYTILGDVNKSIEYQKLAAETEQDDDELWYTLALMLERAGRTDEAQAAYERSIAINQDHSEARNNLGIIFQKKQMLNESRQEFEAALSVAPNASVIVLNYANLLAELGEKGLADENFKRAIALDNTSKTAYRNYAQFLYNNGNYIDAKANLEKSY